MMKQVHNPIYEFTTSRPADFPSEGAEQQADQDNDGGPTHEIIKLSLSLHKRAQTKWNYTSR